MYNFLNVEFYLFFTLFILSVFISFYIPGWVLINKLFQKKSLTTVVLSITLGMVLWAIQAYLFGYLGIRDATYAYLAGSFVIYLKLQKISLNISLKSITKANLLTAFLIIFGLFISLLPVFPSGISIEGVTYFFGGTKDDGLMHLGYIWSMTKNFPPLEPGAHLLEIKNYHYWSDLIIADLVRVWHIPLIHTYFQYFTSFISFLTFLTAIVFVKEIGGERKMMNWFLFFLIFSGDAAYIFMLLLNGVWGFHTPAIDNGAMQLLNLPHATAKVVFLVGLLLFFRSFKNKNILLSILTGLLFASLFGLKVYFALFIALGLASLFIYKVAKENINIFHRPKKIVEDNINFILINIVFILLGALIYFPTNSNAGGLGYYPLEWPKIFLGAQNLNIESWWLRRATYEASSSYLHLAVMDIFAIFVTLISIYGTRIIGFLPSRQIINFFTLEKYIFFIVPILVFQILGLYTLQESGGFNVFNFFSVSTVILALFGAYYMSRLQKRPLHILIALVIITLTIPRAFHETELALSNLKEKFYVYNLSKDEHDALNFVRTNTEKDAVIQSHPSNERDRFVAYISFFSQRYSYLAGVEYLNSHNQDISDLKDNISYLYSDKNRQNIADSMQELNIDILYIQKKEDQEYSRFYNLKGLEKIYENGEVVIFEVHPVK